MGASSPLAARFFARFVNRLESRKVSTQSRQQRPTTTTDDCTTARLRRSHQQTTQRHKRNDRLGIRCLSLSGSIQRRRRGSAFAKPIPRIASVALVGHLMTVRNCGQIPASSSSATDVNGEGDQAYGGRLRDLPWTCHTATQPGQLGGWETNETPPSDFPTRVLCPFACLPVLLGFPRACVDRSKVLWIGESSCLRRARGWPRKKQK